MLCLFKRKKSHKEKINHQPENKYRKMPVIPIPPVITPLSPARIYVLRYFSLPLSTVILIKTVFITVMKMLPFCASYSRCYSFKSVFGLN